MKRLMIGLTICGVVMTAAAQFMPVQLDVKPVTKKKDLAAGYSNAASYLQSRALNITLRNSSQQPVSGLTVRWGVVKSRLGSGRGAHTVAYGNEEIIDLKPMETRTILTPSVDAEGQRWNYLADEGEKIIGHGVQLLLGGKVISEQMTPPTVKPAFEKLQQIEADGDSKSKPVKTSLSHSR